MRATGTIARTAPRGSAKLPSVAAKTAPLATNCLFVGESQRANIVWATDQQFFALCARMLNGNDQNDFVVGFRDDSGKPRYKRAFKANAFRHAQWVLDCIRGRGSRPTTMAFYARNADNESKWGALDFDAHDGNRERPSLFAVAAFNLLLNYPSLRIIVCTSGVSGGWHVILFSDHFHPVADWERLLHQVAAVIGAPIQSGICEIMPRQTRGRFGPALRVPGSHNPRDNSFGEIFFDNVRLTLPSFDLKRLASLRLGKVTASTEGGKNLACELGKEPSFGELDTGQRLYRGKNDAWRTEFAITAPGTRHNKLLALVGHGYPQASREVMRQNADAQYAEASVTPATSRADHLSDFDEMWRGQDEHWLGALSPTEREKVGSLLTETQRAAFKILRGWSRDDPSLDDFYVHARTLAEWLGVSLQGVCELRKRFCILGILRKTEEHKARRRAARYKWLLFPSKEAVPGRVVI